MPRPLLVAALLALAGCGQTVIVPSGSNTTSGAGGATTSSATGGGVAGGGGAICSPHTCEGLGVECGAVFDGCLGTIECGACPAGQSCGAGGVPGKCGGAECGPGSCCPVTCAQHGAECGVVSDGCGGILDCGTCPSGGCPAKTCGGGGVPNVCGGPACTCTTCALQHLACGPAGDGCGGLLDCGTCPAGKACDAGQCL